MYKVIGTVTSRAFRVLWALEEMGEAYELINATPRSEAAVAHNPNGKIPALVDGDEVLTDSVAIMTYLADKHGKLTAPAGTPDRARQDAETLWVIDEFDALLWTAAKHSFVLPEDMRAPDVKPAVKAEFERNVDLFASRIRGKFLMGDQMTIADILAVHCLNWAHSAKFDVSNPDVKAYAKRLRDREAFKAVRALMG